MRVLINIESSFVTSAETIIEVPDGSTPQQIDTLVDLAIRDGKVHFPNLLDGERISSDLSVYLPDDDDNPIEGSEIEELGKSW